VDDRHRREQADEMAHEQDKNSHVEQVRSDRHLLAPQELAGLGTPAVLARVEAQDAADDQHRHREIGVPAEGQLVEKIVHRPASLLAGRFDALIFAVNPVGPPISCAAAALNVTGASSHSSSRRAGSSSGSRSWISWSASLSSLPPARATSAWKIPA